MIDFGKPWTEEEDHNLCKLHNKDKMDIIQISKILDTSPTRIAYRFIENNYPIETIRGYIEYTKTDEYKNYMKEVVILIEEQNKPN